MFAKKRGRSPSTSKNPKSKKPFITPSLDDLTITFSQKSIFSSQIVTGIMGGIITQDTPFFLRCFGNQFVPCMRCLVEVSEGISFYIFYWNKNQYDPYIQIQGRSCLFNALLSNYINHSKLRKDFSKWLLDNISPFQKGDRPLIIDFNKFWGSIDKELIYIIIDRDRFDQEIQSHGKPLHGISVIDLGNPTNRQIFTDSTFFCDIGKNTKGGSRVSKRSNKKLRKTMKRKSTISSFSQ